MTIADKPSQIRAPREHGDVVVVPPLKQASQIVDANRDLTNTYGIDGLPGDGVLKDSHDCDIQGRTFQQLRSDARQDLLRQARAYTAQYREAETHAECADAPILLAGHQPQLFHAGVWFKNFVLSALGKKLKAHAVNFLVDNDIARSSSIRVPTGSLEQPRVENVGFDRAAEPIPHEHRTISDLATFQTFAERASNTVTPFVNQPIVESMWPFASQAANRTGNLGASLAEARHRLEAE